MQTAPCDVVNIKWAILDKNSDVHQAVGLGPFTKVLWCLGLEVWLRYKVDNRES